MIIFHKTVHIQNILKTMFHIILLNVLFFFVSNDEKVEMRLKELKNWLKDCNYLDSVINQSFDIENLQGPAPFTDNSKSILFVTTFYKIIDNEKVVRKIRSKLLNNQSTHLSEVF